MSRILLINAFKISINECDKYVENPNNALKNITKLMKKNSILWIFLYADFGRHRENAIRKGIDWSKSDSYVLSYKKGGVVKKGKKNFPFLIN